MLFGCWAAAVTLELQANIATLAFFSAKRTTASLIIFVANVDLSKVTIILIKLVATYYYIVQCARSMWKKERKKLVEAGRQGCRWPVIVHVTISAELWYRRFWTDRSFPCTLYLIPIHRIGRWKINATYISVHVLVFMDPWLPFILVFKFFYY